VRLVTTASAEEKQVKCTFQVARQVEFGSELFVTGSAYGMGQWDVQFAPTMTWTEGHVWSCSVDIPENTDVEFKYVVRNKKSELHWEPFKHNRTVSVASAPIIITADWGNNSVNVSGEEEEEEEPQVETRVLHRRAPPEAPEVLASPVERALSELVQASLSGEGVGSQEVHPEASDFKNLLLERLKGLRPEEESGTSSDTVEAFVLEVARVAREGVNWRNEHYFGLLQRKQDKFDIALAAETEKVFKLSQGDSTSTGASKISEAELMTRLSKAELLTKLTKSELNEKVRKLETAMGSEKDKILKLTKMYDQEKMTQLSKVKGLESALTVETAKVRSLTQDSANMVKELGRIPSAVSKGNNPDDNAHTLERALAEKKVLADKLAKESNKASMLEKILGELEQKIAYAKESDNVVLLERALSAEERLGQLTEASGKIKAGLAEKLETELETARESMAWRDNLYQQKLSKVEDVMRLMKEQDAAKWVVFKDEHEKLMGIMRNSNAEMEQELGKARAELISRTNTPPLVLPIVS